MTKDIDITNLIGPESTIFGKKNKSTGNPNGVRSSLSVPAAALKTPPPPQYRQKSKDSPSVATGGVEDACRGRSSNIVARDTRIVMSCLSPTAVLSTPPPPKFRPPRWTPNSRSTSKTPRGTPPDGRARCQQEDSQTGESEEQENGDTCTPIPRGGQQGKKVATLSSPQFTKCKVLMHIEQCARNYHISHVEGTMAFTLAQ